MDAGADAAWRIPGSTDGGGALEDGGRTASDDAGTSSTDAGGLEGRKDAGSPGRDAGAPPSGDDCGATAMELAELAITNREREAAGRPPLRCDPGLTRAARLHSQDMCDRRYFSHTSLDGRTMTDRIDAQGVRWSRAGENIARGQTTAEAVHAAWMGSTGHRANILDGRFGRIGIGYESCGGVPLWTQNFTN